METSLLAREAGGSAQRKPWKDASLQARGAGMHLHVPAPADVSGWCERLLRAGTPGTAARWLTPIQRGTHRVTGAAGAQGCVWARPGWPEEVGGPGAHPADQGHTVQPLGDRPGSRPRHQVTGSSSVPPRNPQGMPTFQKRTPRL